MKRLVTTIALLVPILFLPITAIKAISITDELSPGTEINYQPVDFSTWADIAIAWAEYRLGDMNWYEMCASFVANAYMNTEAMSWNDSKAKPAEADAIDLPQRFNLTLQNTESGGWIHAPRGALIFFEKVINNPYGHVAIYLGNNQIIHSYGIVTISNLTELNFGPNNLIIGEYLGWTYPPDPEWRPENQIPQIVTTFTRAVDNSPISFRVYDSTGRVTGSVDGKIKAEIPGSFYYSHSKEITIAPSLENYRIEITSDKEAVYSITIMSSDVFGLLSLNLKNIQTDASLVHRYEIDRDKFTAGENGLNMYVNGETVISDTLFVTFEPYIISSTGPYSFEGTLNYWKITVVNEEVSIPATNNTSQKELNISSKTGGSVINPGEGIFLYDENKTVTLEARAEDGYRFTGWSGNTDLISSIGNTSATLAMNDNYKIVANFEKVSNTIESFITVFIIFLIIIGFIIFYLFRVRHKIPDEKPCR